MPLRQKVDDELKAAMRTARTGGQARLDTIRMLKSAVKYREIELGQSLDDAGVAGVVVSLVKQRRDAAEQYAKGGRPELARKEEDEIVVLHEFLPAQLSAEEVARFVDEAVVEANAQTPKDMGAVMKLLKDRIAGRADGKTLSDAVRARLSGVAKKA